MNHLKTFESFNNCSCGCGNCDDNLTTSWSSEVDNISEALSYHIDSGKLLTENVFRYGSESWFNLINEAREQYKRGNLNLSEADEEIINTDIGKKAFYNGEEVWLDMPMIDESINEEVKYRGKDVKTSKPMRDSGGKKPYKVYVSGCNEKTKSNPRGVKVVRFGSGDLRAKINDSDARKRYDSRHGCSKGRHNDKCKPGYWSCRLPSFSEALGLSGSGRWW